MEQRDANTAPTTTPPPPSDIGVHIKKILDSLVIVTIRLDKHGAILVRLSFSNALAEAGRQEPVRNGVGEPGEQTTKHPRHRRGVSSPNQVKDNTTQGIAFKHIPAEVGLMLAPE